jgi:hypothetical protein
MAVNLDPGPNQVLGPTLVARRFGRGHKWARDLLRQWWEEQQVPGYEGPQRVFRKRGRGGIETYYTTRAALDAYAPQGRDEKLVRAVRDLDKGLDALARRMGDMMDEIRALTRRVAALERRR